MTQEVEPSVPEVRALGTMLAAKAVRTKAAVLTANQFGRTERVCYVNLRAGDRQIEGPIFNLSVTPVTDGEVQPAKKAIKSHSRPNQRMLVPRYTKVEVGFHNTRGEWRDRTVEGEPWSIMWYATELILNGTIEWVETDYLTFKREAPKVGRNDPCPCGRVGRKYKHCCGR